MTAAGGTEVVPLATRSPPATLALTLAVARSPLGFAPPPWRGRAPSLELEIGAVCLGVDKAIPCGLILNELISNALKYAFPNGRPGVVRVELRNLPNHAIALSVADDGIGLPATFDLRTSGSLGMQLVSTLVEQLRGRLEITREAGTRFDVTFDSEPLQ
jgi:two-component sensor histidine kinase